MSLTMMEDLPSLPVGPDVLRDFDAATSREWLVTNGLGGFASGTVSGAHSRRYHGLLVAALAPPLRRTLLLSKLDETAVVAGREWALGGNEFGDGTVSPRGHELLSSFHLDGLVPTWCWTLGDVRLEKRVFMEHGASSTWVLYRHAVGTTPLDLRLLALCTWRDMHSHSHGDGTPPSLEELPGGVRVAFTAGARPYRLVASSGRFAPIGEWYRRFRHREDAARGFDAEEDLFAAGTFEAQLQPGETLTLLATAEETSTNLDGPAALERERARQRELLAACPFDGGPGWARQLVLAADQFIVRRDLPGGEPGRTVIAGYPWFGDWGRDTMIALPGLALATGRPGIAAEVLRTWAQLTSAGMLPNRFPEDDAPPEFNTADAALWLFEAVRAFAAAAPGHALVAEIYPALRGIVDAHLQGTRHGIRVGGDGLLRAGEPGLQLTWMDAKVGESVVTPRIGKPVEINALWHHALRVAADLAGGLGRSDDALRFASLADRAAESLRRRFWHPQGKHLLDVVDGPDGDDASLRPNQIFAVSLRHSPLDRDRQRAVVRSVAGHLLTPFGLRSLAPSDPAYRGRHAGGPGERDAAYHQGTVWAWLIGPFASAHLRAFGDAAAARSLLDAFAAHLGEHGLGTVSEVFDGDPPHAPSGCIAQAWSVAEVLRALVETAPRAQAQR